LGLHRYAVSTHPDETVLEPPLKKFLDPPIQSAIMLKRNSNSIFSIAFRLYSLYTLLAQYDVRKIQNQKLPKSNTNELRSQESELKKLCNFRHAAQI